jgi:antitoxin YefM
VENAGIRIVSNDTGEPMAVAVPIGLWRDIESERETAYLLKPETMKQRLLAAGRQQGGLTLEAVSRNLEFDSSAFEDFAWWIEKDRVQALRADANS